MTATGQTFGQCRICADWGTTSLALEKTLGDSGSVGGTANLTLLGSRIRRLLAEKQEIEHSPARHNPLKKHPTANAPHRFVRARSFRISSRL